MQAKLIELTVADLGAVRGGLYDLIGPSGTPFIKAVTNLTKLEPWIAKHRLGVQGLLPFVPTGY